MTAYTYVHVWPILDETLPLSLLRAEACRDLDRLAELRGAKLTGTPEWSVQDDRLVCIAPARPYDPDAEADDDLTPRAAARRRGRSLDEFARCYADLAGLGVPDWQIASRLGYTPGYLKRHLARARSAGLLPEVAA